MNLALRCSSFTLGLPSESEESSPSVSATERAEIEAYNRRSPPPLSNTTQSEAETESQRQKGVNHTNHEAESKNRLNLDRVTSGTPQLLLTISLIY